MVGGWVVIIELKANLSSTSHLTSQLELSLAIRILLRVVASAKHVAEQIVAVLFFLIL